MYYVEVERVLGGFVIVCSTEGKTGYNATPSDIRGVFNAIIILFDMHDQFVLSYLQVLACNADLRLVVPSSILLFHLDPEDAITEAGHRYNTGIERNFLIRLHLVLPSYHYVRGDAHPNVELVLARLVVGDFSVRVRDRLKSDLDAGLAGYG